MSEGEASHRLAPLYQPDDDGLIVLYVGEMEVMAADERLATVTGQLELRLSPRTSLRAHFAGPFAEYEPASWLAAGVRERAVAIPDGAALSPPAEPPFMEAPDGRSWVDDDIPLARLSAGTLSQVERFLLHFSLGFEPKRWGRGDEAEHTRFSLPGWRVVVAPLGTEEVDERSFGGVVEAVPEEEERSLDDIEKLKDRVYFLLSLVVGREVGVEPTCGLDSGGRVVWADWGVPSLRPNPPTAWWCPPLLAPPALESLAEGYGLIAADPVLEKAAHRALNHLLAADSSEVLDVRVPVACSGLELLSWAVLRRQGWLDQDSFEKLNAAARVRLLLRWAEVPTEMPDQLSALNERRRRLQRVEWEAPEVLFNVRNGLMHPPRRIADPEWPTLDEMIESWQFATWALQLVLLRLLGYVGPYWSRLRLGRSSVDVEPVPWSA